MGIIICLAFRVLMRMEWVRICKLLRKNYVSEIVYMTFFERHTREIQF
jgi:hypothetical protein